MQIPLQSMPITTEVVSLNPVHGEVYSMYHYVIKFVIDLGQVGGFLRILRFPPPIKLTAAIQLKYCGIEDHKPTIKNTRNQPILHFILQLPILIVRQQTLFVMTESYVFHRDMCVIIIPAVLMVAMNSPAFVVSYINYDLQR